MQNPDGSNQLSRPSKLGILTSAITVALAQSGIAWLGTLNLSTVPGWAAGIATVAVSTAIGLLTAYVAKEKRTP